MRMPRALVLTFSVGLFGGLLIGCGIPAHDLNDLEKTADIEWVFGVFERNYAPAGWKEKQFAISLAQAKKDCAEQAKTIVKPDAFVSHLNRCVNRFGDAHTHTMSGGTTLPELAKVAYLGFMTETERVDLANPPVRRTQPDPKPSEPTPTPAPTPGPGKPVQLQTLLHVTKILPTTSDSGDFPIRVDDYIVEIDGKPVADYLTTEILPFGNLGQSNSSLIQAGPIFPVRSSFTHPLPTSDFVQLQVFRSGRYLIVSLPWTVKDLIQFQQEQEEAQKEKSPKTEHKKDDHSKKTGVLNSPLWMGNELFTYLLKLMDDFRMNPGSRVQILLANTFTKYNFNPTLRFLQDLFAAENQPKEGEPLAVEKALPSVSSLKVDNDLFPARVLIQDDGSRIGYIRIETFSIDDKQAAQALSELHRKFIKLKVKGVMYDTLNNGGGSLVAGLRLANLLTTKPLLYPTLQMALNENWMNAFHADSIYKVGTGTGSDSRRTLAARIFRILSEDQKAGLRISRPISSTELDPFILNEDKALCQSERRCLDSEIKRVLLVNEMCASMCDIFAAMFRDNKMGTIIGSQTMGAGGNVVMHGTSPVSQIMMTQTESLILDADGKYLENQGVLPDIAVDTLYDRINKYSATYKKALAALQ
jgi:C-terminal processing protease CtpA/Prc